MRDCLIMLVAILINIAYSMQAKNYKQMACALAIQQAIGGGDFGSCSPNAS